MTDDFGAGDWEQLRVLRGRFLSQADGGYWTPRGLELYDATFAQRIGWKWDEVLGELGRGGWRPSASMIIDWGCGTGVAGRVVSAWSGIRSVLAYDRSSAASAFALQRLKMAGLDGKAFDPCGGMPADSLLIVSHVAGELGESELASLANFAAEADEVIWVEPGSREVGARLHVAHAALRRAGHTLLAPCTHGEECPARRGPGDDWCHFFASPPPEIFQSAFWHRFSREVGVDLRALPFSFLASSRRASAASNSGAERLIGRPRVFKGRCELLCCGAGGLAVRELQKRDAPGLFRQLCNKGKGGAFLWQSDPSRPNRILGGTPAN